MSDENILAVVEDEMEVYTCAECEKPVTSKQQMFENDHCGHPLCELCRFLQETKCKSCVKKDAALSLDTEKNSSIEENNGLEKNYNIKKKRNSWKSYKHIVPVKGNSEKYKCMICCKEVKKQSISYHFSCVDEKKPLSCAQCEKTFVKRSHLECHVLSHLGIKPYKCMMCPKAFMQKDKLKRHEKIHSDERPFVCNICSKSFITNEEFKKHLLSHSEARTFRCDICPRTYKNRKNLTIHKLKHTGTKNFVCETCGKRYRLLWQLNAHCKQHKSKKDFKCMVCERRFYTQQQLKRHTATHSDICDFECSICNTAFKRKDNLERHMRNLHEIPSPIKTGKNMLSNDDSKKTKSVNEVVPNCSKKPNSTICTKSVIVSPEKLNTNLGKPKACPVSVIVSARPAKTQEEMNSNTEISTAEMPKLLPYRVLPPDKRFKVIESKNCVPTIMNLKAMHIVRTSDTGESNIQTIITTDDKTNQVGKDDSKMYAIDAQAELCKKAPQGKDDKMNKCFRIINHTDSILANNMKDNLTPKKNFKFRKSSLYQSNSLEHGKRLENVRPQTVEGNNPSTTANSVNTFQERL